MCEYAPSADVAGPLVVEIDGTTVGLIEFGRSARPEAATALRRIRDLAPVPVALVSNRSEADVAALASLLGVELYKGGFSPEDTARFLRACRDRGLRTAFVGQLSPPCGGGRRGRRRGLARGRGRRACGPSPRSACSCNPGWTGFADLWEIARSHEGRVHEARKLVLVPNVLCVAGAFLFGFTGLTAVMISNLGTFNLFHRAVRSLRELQPSGRQRWRH